MLFHTDLHNNPLLHQTDCSYIIMGASGLLSISLLSFYMYNFLFCFFSSINIGPNSFFCKMSVLIVTMKNDCFGEMMQYASFTLLSYLSLESRVEAEKRYTLEYQQWPTVIDRKTL